ncbi:neutral zinc metallopeptidase [Limnoraphis robusta]|uniref:Neutral zinc metallopeptidase n=1 Tax=Limnoraphis robusta CCNP1315 TaxID=3110306 RepID=A0ABU5U7F9_9CYAN|nr:neutral zinc metallopeptidase [Limnoraphis robusta]MEA5522543.1 neutral zinc metallopeptidase [Limnoraphis robusta CCNP1315]MEA5548286.1 neutral zinc metallopeptidase [Limnoraphis robusta CCNP1324]
MRWQLGRRSDNVEDRRGSSPGGRIAIGGGIGSILLALAALFLGIDPGIILQEPREQSSYPDSSVRRSPEEEELVDFVSVVLGYTEDTWQQIFRERGETYVEPELVLFSDAVESACGYAEAATGPFYCPRDQKVYIDLSFYKQLKNRLNAPGDFAQAYVIAHEVGHHVQTLLGISQQVNNLQRKVDKVSANELSVRQELQADCFAGVWANRTQKAEQVLEQGDVEEAMNAASSIGDDHLQRQSQGYVVPDSFTHGTSAQRVRWFERGLQTGNIDECNTFATENL